MEPIGLAIGVVGLVGLFSSCLEAADKVQAYLSFGTESGVLDARFRATKVLLEKWGRRVGLEKTTLAEDHHPALDDRNIAAAVEDVLRIINTICESSNQSIPQSKLTPSLVDGFSLGSIGPPSLHGMRRRKLTWALWGKGKRTDQVELLETLVQQLNNLVPPDATDMLSSGKAPGHASLAELQRILARIEETRREVYSWLDRSIPNEHYDDSIQKKLVGTCDWIFERVVFQNWLSSEFTVGAKLLWINGPAGFGKTILCANIVDHLVPTLTTPVAHFFFSSELENREDPFLAIRSWISQIASQHEPAYKHVRRVWEQDLDFVSTRLTAISLFAQLLHIVPNCTLIADGLDECTHLDDSNASVAKFLRIVAGAVDGTNTRVLVVSRDEPQIRHAITDNALWSFDEYKISRHDVRSDTAAYSRHIINRKLPNKNDVVRSTLSEAMADRCEGQFLWLKMQEESLRKGLNMKQLRRAIEETPAGLHGLYDRNWSRIKSCRDRERIFSLLRWAAFALRPLTACEITEAVLITDSDDLPVDDLPDTVDGDYVDSEIVDLCGPLIQVRRQKSDGSAGQQTVHLAHFSVRQFLLVNLPTPGWISENERLRANYQNTLLARACLYYINFERVWQEITDHASSLGTALRNYAAGAWHHHFKSGICSDEEVLTLAIRFFDRSSKTWNAWRAWSDEQDAKAEGFFEKVAT
ncbi:prion-inhibition and propagation-domain-containing protein, partial [Fusarium oxysporum f. sp. albedinis]